MSPKMDDSWAPKRRRAFVTLIDNITLNDDPTSYNSAAQAVDIWRNFLLYLDVDSAGTDVHVVQFIVQFSDDGGTTWYDYKQGLFASLFYEDVDTADGVTECFSGVVHGRDMRLRAVATGTSGTLTFTITAKVEFWS